MAKIGFLIPVRKYFSRTGHFDFPEKVLIASPRIVDKIVMMQLAEQIKRQIDKKVKICLSANDSADIQIIRNNDIINREGYQIDISTKKIIISASDDAGVYYAIQTIRELLLLNGNKLPACKIHDWPDFKRRGVYYDCARGKVPSVKTLKELIERLAHWKINELQLYIENGFKFSQHPDISRGYSPFTPEDIAEIQEYCKVHHIKLVGSLASFGHFEKILSLSKYRHLAEYPGFHNLPGGTTLCPINPGSLKLISDLFKEFIPLFEAEDFNVCCDETFELGKGRSKKICEDIGVGRVYLDFVLKIYELCMKHGKRMNMWADIVLSHPNILKEIPNDIVILNWAYKPENRLIKKTKDIARAGFPFMACPSTNSWLSHGTRLTRAIENVSVFSKEARKYNAEGILNTDWGNQGHRNFLGVSLHGFAHAAAHSWNGRKVDDESFTENFCLHTFGGDYKRIAKSIRLLGNTYKDLDPVAGIGMYRALVEPLKRDTDCIDIVRASDSDSDEITNSTNKDSIDTIPLCGLRKTITRLQSDNLWPEPSEHLANFEKLAIKEYALASEMELLACYRVLAAKKIRSGQTVSSQCLKSQVEKLRVISSRFEKLWKARNRVSRLKDNVSLFEKTIGEDLEIAHKMKEL